MSKVSIQGDPNGTGDFTIKAPNSNTDRTLGLPDEAGTVLTNVSDIETQVKTATNATGSAPVYACRAWVNFDGTGTVSIRGSGNVSSITDNRIGDYDINFATAMPDTNYCFTTTNRVNETIVGGFQSGINTSNVNIQSKSDTSTGTRIDSALLSLAVFR